MPTLPMLVEPAWLHDTLGAADLRIIDATWYLPAHGRDAAAEYADGHLPGAIHLDLASDLADTSAPLRNTIATPAALAASFAAAGIGSEHRVVVYDRLAGFSAGRVWWALRYAGHAAVALLNGGLEAWVVDGYPLECAVPDYPAARFEAEPATDWIRSREDVLHILESHSAQIVDAREAERFRGEGPEPTAHKGHIPGSANLPYDRQLSGEPKHFADAETLRVRYREAGVDLESAIVTTCGSGVTAALNAFVLTWLGVSNVAVYDGSWAEWGDRDDTPKASGGPTRP